MATLRFLCWLASWLLLTAVGVAQEAGGDSADAKPVTLSVAIGKLREEGTATWKGREPWPREECDFAQARNWSLKREEVLQALTRRLHRERGIDAYIKWQLLSFIEEVPAEDLGALNRVTAYSPEPVVQPTVKEEWLAVSGPGGASMTMTRQVAYVQNLVPVVGNGVVGLQPVIGTVGEGVGLGVEGSTKSYVTVVRKANTKLENARKDVDLSNEAIIRFRDALAERLPEAGGVRLAVRIKDLRERIVAGEPSTGALVATLLKETDPLPEGLPEPTRKTLTGWLADTARLRKPVVDSVALSDDGERAVLKGHVVGIALEDAQVLVDRLQPGAKLKAETEEVPGGGE